MNKLISVPRLFGKFVPEGVNYIFGDASYIREQIVTLKSAGIGGNFPLVGLYWTSSDRVEMNVSKDILMRVNLNFIVADSSTREGNEKRMESVYENILYPKVDEIIGKIESSGIFEFGPMGKASFSYSDGYETPFHGLVDNTGKDLAEIIDFVCVRRLVLNFRDNECKLREFIE